MVNINFDKLSTKFPLVRDENLFYNFPKQYKRDNSNRKIKEKKIEDLMISHVDLNPFVIKQNADLYGHFAVKCKSFSDKEGKIGYSEETIFTRVYKNKNNCSTVCSLSPKGKALFLWIIYSISFYKGFVLLNEKRITRMANGLNSPNSFKSAIKELVDAKIISVYIHPYYWVNPRFFFLGNRAYGYANYKKIRHSLQDDLELKEENPDEIY